jgi:hypothetical protein
VYLATSHPTIASVPASITIPAGSKTSTFSITTASVSTATAVEITATYESVSKSARLLVQPSTTTDAKIASFWLYPATIKGGATTTNNRVTLDKAAGPNGAIVSLASSNPDVAHVPPQITIAPGRTYASFSLTSASVAETTTVSITALIGTTSRTVTLTVVPVSILRVELVRSIVGGRTAPYSRVGFDGPVPPGAVVTLSSSNPAVAAVPASVNALSPGVYSAHFPISTGQVTTPTPVTISASYRGVTVTAAIIVQPHVLTGTSPLQEAE